jgi:hypothetical protein
MADLPDIPILRHDIRLLELEQYVCAADAFWTMDTIRLLLQDVLLTSNKDITDYHCMYLKVVEFKPISLRQALHHVAHRYRRNVSHPAGHNMYSRTVNLYFSTRPPLPRRRATCPIDSFQIPEVIVNWGSSARLYRNVKIGFYNPDNAFGIPFVPIYEFSHNNGELIEQENTFLDATTTYPEIDRE